MRMTGNNRYILIPIVFCLVLCMSQVSLLRSFAFKSNVNVMPADLTTEPDLIAEPDLTVVDNMPPPPLNASFLESLPHPHAGARYPNGSLGYIADPTLLRRTILSSQTSYLELLRDYQNEHRRGMLFDSFDFAGTCHMGPGRSWEDEGGFKLLTEKIRIFGETKQPRLFCALYSYSTMRNLVRAQALSWGWKCDGFLVFSTETIPELNIVEIVHEGPESYQNMWQKTRSIWSYIYRNYANDYDFFHMGGDDLYIVVENMKRFLAEAQQHSDNSTSLFLGSWADHPKRVWVAGAPGYTLNRKALKEFGDSVVDKCAVNTRVSHEDRTMSNCLADYLGIMPYDTREYHSGEPQYHDAQPHHLYTFRAAKEGQRTSFHAKVAAYWETLPLPSNASGAPKTGPKHELEAAAKYSVAFHDIYHPEYVARLHVLLFPETCPADSVLGKALRRYRTV